MNGELDQPLSFPAARKTVFKVISTVPMNTGELQKLPLFSDLSPEESSCLEQGEEILVQAGEIFFRPAD